MEKEVSELKEKLQMFEKATVYKTDSEGLPTEPAAAVISGHRKTVWCVIFHPIFQLLFSASEDGTIKVWDYDNKVPRLERTLGDHTQAVTDIGFNPKGTRMASGSVDASIKIWDLPGFECIKTLQGHESTVSAIRFSPDGDFLISGSRDKTVKIWELINGHCTRTITAHTEWVRCLAVPPFPGLRLLASAGNDKCIVFHRLSDHSPPFQTLRHDHVVEFVTFGTPQLLRHLAAYHQAPPPLPESFRQSCLEDGGNRIQGSSVTSNVDRSTRRESQVLERAGLVLLSASRDRCIKLWDVISGGVLQTFTGHDNWVRSIAVHSSGKHIISCSDDRTIRSWDVLTGACSKLISAAHTGFVTSIAMNIHTTLAASASLDCTIKLWECKKQLP